MFADPDITAMETRPVTQERTWSHPSALHYRDILILFESDVTEDTPMVKSLIQSGIPVEVIHFQDQKSFRKSNSDTVLVVKANSLCRLRRKVVVYVEGTINRTATSGGWSRFLGITSCTSQLVILRWQ